jgi:hypothetical protein
VLAYKITNWSEAPGLREAHLVVTPEKRRETSKRNARARTQRIARLLGEKDSPSIHHAIGCATRRLGLRRVEQLVEQAQAIHRGPGMLVRDGSRNRTLGGIFFHLAKLGADELPSARGSAAGAVDRDER